jgi:hypothetical protein
MTMFIKEIAEAAVGAFAVICSGRLGWAAAEGLEDKVGPTVSDAVAGAGHGIRWLGDKLGLNCMPDYGSSPEPAPAPTTDTPPATGTAAS